jgi:hypothetical protein
MLFNKLAQNARKSLARTTDCLAVVGIAIASLTSPPHPAA